MNLLFFFKFLEIVQTVKLPCASLPAVVLILKFPVLNYVLSNETLLHDVKDKVYCPYLWYCGGVVLVLGCYGNEISCDGGSDEGSCSVGLFGDSDGVLGRIIWYYFTLR